MKTLALVHFEIDNTFNYVECELSVYRWWYDTGVSRYFEEYPAGWYKNHITAEYNPIWSYASSISRSRKREIEDGDA